ncbi:MAG: hypothetical protein ACYDAA_07355 [Syntrophales bacterium]
MIRAFSKIWLINISLVVCVAFFGIMSFEVWSKRDETIQEMQTGKRSEKPLPGKGIVERTMPPESNYGIVADKNLFSPKRVEFIPEKVEGGPLKISEKMIFLYGVIVTGDRKMALINNPDPGPQAGKKPARDKWVKVGDAIGNFSVTDIRKDRIILTGGASTHEILLYDKNKPARKIIIAEKAATPVAATAGPAAAAATAAAKPDDQRSTAPPKSGGVEGKSASEGEYRIVNTPFGPTKRRVQ